MEPDLENGNKEPEPQLTPKQEAAIAALISHNTVKKAAAAAGVTEVTLWRWQKQPHFHKAYMVARWKVVQQAMANIQNTTSKAAAFLAKVLDDDLQDPRIKMAATRLVLSSSLKAVELEDHAERMNEIQDDIEVIKASGLINNR